MSSENTVRLRDLDGDENLVKRPCSSSQNMKITSVNDDCLIAIFSHLSLADLAAVRKSCERFHYAADECAEKILRDYEDFFIDGSDYEESALISDQFGQMIEDVYMAFEKDYIQWKCKYFLLLKQCTAMEFLSVTNVDFFDLLVDPLEILPLKNVRMLSFLRCSGTLANFERFLSALDPLRLVTLFYSPADVTVELLTFIAERMINLRHLSISIKSCTPLFVEKLTKLQNLRKLKEFDIRCNESLPLEMIIESLVKLKSRSISLGTIRISNETAATAMNKLSKHIVRFRSESKSPESLIDQMNGFDYKNCEYSQSHRAYTYNFNSIGHQGVKNEV